MALIDCPSCGKKISDKTKKCPHCQFDLANLDVEELSRRRGISRYKKLMAIQTQSMIAIMMFITGFAFIYWGNIEPTGNKYKLAIACSTVGFFWYVVNRVRLVLIKRSS
jgi:uncharacterized membrane protein YvbJ